MRKDRPVSAAWDPANYDLFAEQRRQPFDDLLAMVEPCPGGRVVDLGCGTGALTAELHRTTAAAETLGIDTSPVMLERARPDEASGLSFAEADIATFEARDLDVVFANSALQWVPDHAGLLPRLAGSLRAGGQLAFQVPANYDHPSHRLAVAMAGEHSWRSAFGGSPPADRGRDVLAPEAYALLLDGLGMTSVRVRLVVYLHHLRSTEAVVEWVTGTLLTPYRAALDDEGWGRFVEEYTGRLVARLGRSTPYPYAFKRILVHCRQPG